MSKTLKKEMTSAYIGFDPSNLTGVVILCNCEDVDILVFGDKILEVINKY